MPDADDEIYDFSDPSPAKPVPVIPAAAPTLGYETPKTAEQTAAVIDERRPERTLRLPLILTAAGLLMVFGPVFWEVGFSIDTTLYLSAYLLVRFVMAAIATLLIAYGMSISMGSGQAYALRLLAIVCMSEGAMFTAAGVIGSCIGFPIGILCSLAVCWFLFTKLLELEAPENLLAAIAYWLPGLCGIFIILRVTDWLVGLVR